MRLAVTADDYGLTVGISQGILDAHRDGIVTGTSVLVVGPAFADAVRWLDDAPDLAVGIHLAVVGEDPPLLSAREIPTLVDGRGRLAMSWRQLVPRLAARRVDPDDLTRELEAQVDTLLAAGHRPVHVNSHQNLHLWPSVAALVVDLAQRHGIPVVRVPSGARGLPGPGVALLARLLRRRLAAAGLEAPDGFAGLGQAGHMHGPALEAGLYDLAARVESAELVVHPGHGDDPERARYHWGYEWDQELAALCRPETKALVDRLGITLVGLGAAG